jgi:excisionase family DNA binding protein
MASPSRQVPNPESEPTITIDRAAAILGVGVRGMYRAAERDEIPVVRVGRTIRVLTGKFLRQYGLEPA